VLHRRTLFVVSSRPEKLQKKRKRTDCENAASQKPTYARIARQFPKTDSNRACQDHDGTRNQAKAGRGHRLFLVNLRLRRRVGHCLIRQLEARQQLGRHFSAGTDAFLDPVGFAATQDDNLLAFGVDDPIFLDTEVPVFLPLVDVVAIRRTLGYYFDC
jgi:hypothetical protein